jgi:hypothetical protein
VAVVAYLRNGASFTLAASEGSTPEEVRARVLEQLGRSLTGSAAPDVWLETQSGGKVRYSAVDALDLESDAF